MYKRLYQEPALTLPPEALDRLWNHWVEGRAKPEYLQFISIYYRRIRRNSQWAVDFEKWIEDNGGKVAADRDNVRCIEVWDEEKFMMLVLAHV